MSLLTFARLRLSLVIIGLLLVAGAASLALRGRITSLRANASTAPVVATDSLPTLRGEAAVEQLKQQGVYASLNEAVARTRYNLQRSEGKALPARLKLNGEVWHAANPAQNLNAYFAREGVKVVERSEGKPGWELGLRVTGYGYGKRLVELAPGEMRAAGNRIEYTRPVVNTNSAIPNPQSALKEWYVNSSAGVEQGFTIDAAPGEKPAGEALRVRMELAAGWQAELAANGQAITLSGQRGEQLRYAKLAAWDANQQPLKAWMEVEGEEVRLAVDDANAVYPVTIDPTLSQQAQLRANDGAAFDQFGWSVAISGGTVVVGANIHDVGADRNQGAAFVFVRTGTAWVEQQKLLASDGTAFDHFGSSVAISGETIVVGAEGDDVDGFRGNEGSTYVFVRTGTTWVEQQKLVASDGTGVDSFGWSVAISGKTIVVGAYNDYVNANGGQGSVYVFVRTGTTWIEQQKLLASDGAAFDRFGSSVVISGETIVVGALTDDVGANGDRGSAYVFVRTGATWVEQQKLVASDGAANDQFGISVAISGETVVVGAESHNVSGKADQGSAYVFVRTGAAWVEQQKLLASDGAAFDRFGYSVAISGETIIVGARLDDAGGGDRGSAYVFVRTGAAWVEQQKLLASDGVEGDAFGWAVAISGETVVVGALLDDVGTTINQGSAYIFVCNNCTGNTAPDLTLTKSDGGATASSGTTIVYNLNYANVSVAQATGVTLTETVPVGTTYNAAISPGWTCTPNGNAGAACTLSIGSLAVGASGQKTFAVTVDSPVAAGINQIGNTASIFDDGTHGTDPTLPNTASDATPLNATPALTLTKSANVERVAPGGTISYALGYANIGIQGATGVVITETVPTNTTFNAAASTTGWSCAGSTCTFNVGSLSSAAVGSVNFAVTVAASLPSGVQQISNSASVRDDGANSTSPSSASASVTTPINSPSAPVANNDSYSTTRDTALTVAAPGVLGNDTGSGTLTAVRVSGPTSGTLTLNSNGSFTYTPAAGFIGTVSFVYKANNGAADSNNATVTINVTAGSNQPPVANNNSYSTNQGTALVVPAPGVLGNDTDPDGNPLTAALVTNPASGTLNFNPNGSFTYTPAANFSGSVSFTYRANDGVDNSNVATVTITVNAGNAAPVANADSKTTNEDTPLTFPASQLTANDTDANNDTLTVTSVGAASNGTVALAGGNVTFTPAANRNSPSTAFSFSYTISDGKGGTASATVRVTVNAINDAPSFTLVGNPPPSVAGVQNVMGYARNISAGPPDEAGQALAFRLTVVTTTGGLAFTAAPAINVATGNLTFTVAANTSGTAIVSAILMDNGSGVAPNVNTSAPQTFTITVGAVNTPPIARNDSYTTNEDTTLTVPAPGVRANDTDAEGGTLTAALVTAPSSGRLTFSSDGSFSYTPVANFFGTVTFAYRVSDGAANSNTATVTITVNPVNDAPDAVDDEAISLRNTPVTINVLANDSSTSDTGETLRVLSVTQGMLGTVTINANGTITYTPGAVFTGRDMFTYTVSDGNGGTDTATVSVEGSHLLDPTPLSVLPGGEVTIKWTVPEGSAARDWIGFFRAGAPNSAYDRSRWFYTGGAATGSRTIRVPQTPGQYEFRYFLNNGFTLVSRSVVITVGTPTCPTVSSLSRTSGGVRSSVILTGTGFAGVTAVSFAGANARFLVIRDTLIIAIVPASAVTGPITLTKAGCPVAQSAVFTVNSNYSLSATPASVAPGGRVTVRWTAPAGDNARDRIGLFRIGERNPQPLTVFNTDGATSGSRTITMPTTPGQYEFRFLGNRRWGGMRASLPVTVTAP